MGNSETDPLLQLILSLTNRLRTWYDNQVRNYAPTLFGAFSFLAQALAPFVSVFLSALLSSVISAL